VGAYPAQDSNFVLLEFGAPALPPVVYVEGTTGTRYIDREADVDSYRAAVGQLRDSALNPRESMVRLSQLRTAFGGG
jgi:hypothetical protein